MTPDELAEAIRLGRAPVVVDVRSAPEYAQGHVPGARHVPFWHVRRLRQLTPDLDTPITVYCGHGPRAGLAAAVLRHAGFRRVSLLDGHMAAWRRAGLPLERPGRHQSR
jgi:rhodanese-related sulfurtransferase